MCVTFCWPDGSSVDSLVSLPFWGVRLQALHRSELGALLYDSNTAHPSSGGGMNCAEQGGGRVGEWRKDGNNSAEMGTPPAVCGGTVQAPKAKAARFPRVKRTRKCRGKPTVSLLAEEREPQIDACVQPSLPRGLVSISTHGDRVWQLRNRQEIDDPRIHAGSNSSLRKASSAQR